MNYKMADLDYQVPNLPNQSQSLIVEMDEEGDTYFLYVPKSREFDRDNGGSYPYQDDNDDHDPFSDSLTVPLNPKINMRSYLDVFLHFQRIVTIYFKIKNVLLTLVIFLGQFLLKVKFILFK